MMDALKEKYDKIFDEQSYLVAVNQVLLDMVKSQHPEDKYELYKIASKYIFDHEKPTVSAKKNNNMSKQIFYFLLTTIIAYGVIIFCLINIFGYTTFTIFMMVITLLMVIFFTIIGYNLSRRDEQKQKKPRSGGAIQSR